MLADGAFEGGIQALLDGQPLAMTHGESHAAAARHPLQVVDAIARMHRLALFGCEAIPEPAIAQRWGHLEIRAEVGRGASGTVFRAWDARLAREVALKLFTAEAGAGDALEEGRLLARLNHPHIVRVFGADIHGGIAGIWMELLDGETLDEILARDGIFSAEETLFIGIDLAQALAAVHSAGLLHRDIKARNVLRERGGRIVLMDLGAGRAVQETPMHGDATGTPMYMAPEVLAGGPATIRSDLYCLGVLLYRLLTGAFPVRARTLDELRAAHAAGRRLSLATARPDLSSGVVAAIERCCHPDVESRCTTAAEAEMSLREALHVLMAKYSAHPFATRWWYRWRKPALAAAAASIVMAGIIAGAWDTPPGRSTRRTFGMAVAPLSPLYLAGSGGLMIVRGRTVSLVPHNPGNAGAIAVSSDLGVRTMATAPPWVPGASFALDGSPLPAPSAVPPALCCFYDGTTDGEFNYAARADSTLLEPIGSRALAPPALYRFKRDWTDPEPIFPLTPVGYYSGVAYAGSSQTFWVSRNDGGASILEQWDRSGKRLTASERVLNTYFAALAVDPKDGTLWAVRSQGADSMVQFDNFDPAGRYLSSLRLERPLVETLTVSLTGAEFPWVRSN